MGNAAQNDGPQTYRIELVFEKEPPEFSPETTDCTDRDTIDFTTDNGSTVKIDIIDKQTKIPVSQDVPGSWAAVAGDYTIEYHYKGGTTTGNINVVVA